jgi:MFS transporter, ACS family, glucarate transporter
MKKRYEVLALLGVFSIITYMDRTSISLTGDSITTDLDLTEKQFGFIAAVFAFAYGVFDIPTGMLGDKWGPRKVLIRIVIWWSIFTIITGFSYSFLMLVVVRFFFGMGEAGAYPNATVAISRWFPKVERGRAQSIVWMGSRIGGALTPFLVIPIMANYGWRWVFYIFGAIGFVWVLIWALWFKDEPRDMKGISDAEVKEIEEGREVKSASHALSWASWKHILKSGNLWALMMMYHCLLYGAYFYLSWMPKYLKKGRGVADEDMAFMASLPFILGVLGCFIGGFASDALSKKYGLKLGRRIMGMSGLIMAGICMIAATFIANNSISIVVLSLGLAFKDFTLPVSWAVAGDIGGKNSGSISGAMGMMGQLGSAVMSILFAYILSLSGSWEIPVQVMGCIVIVGGLLWLKIDASKKIEFISET